MSGFRAVAQHLQERAGLDSSACYETAKTLYGEGGRKDVFNVLLEEFGVPEALVSVSDLVSLYREHKPGGNYRLYDDVPACLPFFNGHYRCALLTDGCLQQQKNKIEALGIESLFFPIHINEDREFFKPHPHSYLGIIDAWQVEPASITVVGDNPAKDFITPAKMGMTTVRIRRHGVYSRSIGKKEGRAEFSVKDLHELRELMKRLT
jgi:putative hydrolase of the HAD superfamily